MSWGQLESLLAAPRRRVVFRSPIPHFDFVSSNLERALLRDPDGAADEAAHLAVVVEGLVELLERSLPDGGTAPPAPFGAGRGDEPVRVEVVAPEISGAAVERLLDLYVTSGEGRLLERAGGLLGGPAADAASRPLARVAEMLLWTGRADDTALALLRLVESRFPSDPLVLELIGDVYLWNLGRPGLAEPFFRRALALDPENQRLVDYLEQIQAARAD
jgi:hypothetical protein